MKRLLACGDALKNSGEVERAVAEYKRAFKSTTDRLKQFEVFERIEWTSLKPTTDLNELAPEVVPQYVEWKRKREESQRQAEAAKTAHELRKEQREAEERQRKDAYRRLRIQCEAECRSKEIACKQSGDFHACTQQKWACDDGCRAFK